MKLFFWQNINSIHQSVFFRELATNSAFDTTLVVTEKIHPQRVEMGWGSPEIEGLNVIDLSENDEAWTYIIDNNKDANSIHMFSGIHAFPKVFRSLNYAISKKCRVGIFTEPYDFRGFKGFLRQMRGYFYKWKYDKHIDIILTTGKIGVNQFLSFGFSDTKVFEWAYCVEKSANKNYLDLNESFKIIYAGSMIPRKGFDILLKAFQLLKLQGLDFKANLYCLKEDDLENQFQILDSLDLSKNVKLFPFLPNLNLREKIVENDLFILPSRHDGWGAVVSESLAEGIPVLVSNKAGSSTLINQFNGAIIDELTPKGIQEAIMNFINRGKYNLKERENIKRLYEENTSGFSLVLYFNEIIKFVYNESSTTKPRIPWSLTIKK